MKNVIIFLFSGTPILCIAQPIIPWATQQPAWVFPLYFEDAIGQRDTIYIGYDTDADYNLGGGDSIFGEIKIFTDTSVFHVQTGSYFPDTILKVDITRPNPGTGKLYYNITFTHFFLPLKIKWNKNLFYSDALPFPSQMPLPTAQAIFWMGSLSSEDFNCGATEPILITDTSNDNCSFSDSLILDWPFSWNPSSEGIPQLIIEPWTGLLPVGISELKKNEIKFFPNPADDKLYLITEDNESIDYIIYDITGNIIKKSKINNTFIEIAEIANGIYFIVIERPENTITKKIIIHH